MAEFSIGDRVEITDGPHMESVGRVVDKQQVERGSGPVAGDRLPSVRGGTVYDIQIITVGVRPDYLKLLESDT